MNPELINAEKALFWAQKARRLKLPDAEQLYRQAEIGQNPAALYDLALEQFQAYQYESALLTMERSAKQGYAPAMIWCGQKMEKGIPARKQSDFASMQPDSKNALQWYDKAAPLGDPEGQFQRGRLCERGLGRKHRRFGSDGMVFQSSAARALWRFSRFFALYPQHMWDAFEKRLADQ